MAVERLVAREPLERAGGQLLASLHGRGLVPLAVYSTGDCVFDSPGVWGLFRVASGIERSHAWPPALVPVSVIVSACIKPKLQGVIPTC